jgi:hypothetical protein
MVVILASRGVPIKRFWRREEPCRFLIVQSCALLIYRGLFKLNSVVVYGVFKWF